MNVPQWVELCKWERSYRAKPPIKCEELDLPSLFVLIILAQSKLLSFYVQERSETPQTHPIEGDECCDRQDYSYVLDHSNTKHISANNSTRYRYSKITWKTGHIRG